MEKALFASTLDAAVCIRGARGFSRLYFGNEFCQNLLPSEKELTLAQGIAKDAGADFTLVTPIASDAGIERMRRLFVLLPKGTEVVANDFGVLNLIAREFKGLVPVLGRVLSRQTRDPRLLRLDRRLYPSKIALGAEPLSQPAMRKFLKTLGVKRVEFDNAPGFDQDVSKTGFRGTIYHPYSYVTVSRLCPFAEPQKEVVGIAEACSRNCRRCSATLKNPRIPGALFVRGNACFVLNQSVPNRLTGRRGFDRLVWEPCLP